MLTQIHNSFCYTHRHEYARVRHIFTRTKFARTFHFVSCAATNTHMHCSLQHCLPPHKCTHPPTHTNLSPTHTNLPPTHTNHTPHHPHTTHTLHPPTHTPYSWTRSPCQIGHERAPARTNDGEWDKMRKRRCGEFWRCSNATMEINCMYACRKRPRHVCMHVHMSDCIYACVYVYVSDQYMYAYVYIHLHIYKHTRTHIHLLPHTHMYTHTHTLINAYILLTYIHTYMCIYMHILIHSVTYMHVYT